MKQLQIPCTITSASLRKLAVSTHAEADTHHVFISYDGDIQMSRVTVDKFEFLESLNYLGSNLGLWPGLWLYKLNDGASAFILSSSGPGQVRVRRGSGRSESVYVKLREL